MNSMHNSEDFSKLLQQFMQQQQQGPDNASANLDDSTTPRPPSLLTPTTPHPPAYKFNDYCSPEAKAVITAVKARKKAAAEEKATAEAAVQQALAALSQTVKPDVAWNRQNQVPNHHAAIQQVINYAVLVLSLERKPNETEIHAVMKPLLHNLKPFQDLEKSIQKAGEQLKSTSPPSSAQELKELNDDIERAEGAAKALKNNIVSDCYRALELKQEPSALTKDPLTKDPAMIIVSAEETRTEIGKTRAAYAKQSQALRLNLLETELKELQANHPAFSHKLEDKADTAANAADTVSEALNKARTAVEQAASAEAETEQAAEEKTAANAESALHYATHAVRQAAQQCQTAEFKETDPIEAKINTQESRIEAKKTRIGQLEQLNTQDASTEAPAALKKAVDEQTDLLDYQQSTLALLYKQQATEIINDAFNKKTEPPRTPANDDIEYNECLQELKTINSKAKENDRTLSWDPEALLTNACLAKLNINVALDPPEATVNTPTDIKERQLKRKKKALQRHLVTGAPSQQLAIVNTAIAQIDGHLETIKTQRKTQKIKDTRKQSEKLRDKYIEECKAFDPKATSSYNEWQKAAYAHALASLTATDVTAYHNKNPNEQNSYLSRLQKNTSDKALTSLNLEATKAHTAYTSKCCPKQRNNSRIKYLQGLSNTLRTKSDQCHVLILQSQDQTRSLTNEITALEAEIKALKETTPAARDRKEELQQSLTQAQEALQSTEEKIAKQGKEQTQALNQQDKINIEIQKATALKEQYRHVRAMTNPSKPRHPLRELPQNDNLRWLEGSALHAPLKHFQPSITLSAADLKNQPTKNQIHIAAFLVLGHPIEKNIEITAKDLKKVQEYLSQPRSKPERVKEMLKLMPKAIALANRRKWDSRLFGQVPRTMAPLDTLKPFIVEPVARRASLQLDPSKKLQQGTVVAIPERALQPSGADTASSSP
jgi:hypothetical protein